MEGRTGSDVFGDEVGVLPHAVAGALDLNDHGVMEQPVECRPTVMFRPVHESRTADLSPKIARLYDNRF